MTKTRTNYLGKTDTYNFKVISTGKELSLNCVKDDIKSKLVKLSTKKLEDYVCLIEFNDNWLNELTIAVAKKEVTLAESIEPKEDSFISADRLEPVNPKVAVLRKMKLIQNDLKIEKGNNVRAGAKTFNYWSADDILKQVKPLLDQYNCVIELSDKILHFQDEGKIITKTKNKMGDPLNTSTTQSRFYIQTTATLYDCETGGFIESIANAREQTEKLGMDDPQLTGSSSSYARKFALSGLLLLDDNKDPDAGDDKK